MNYIKYLTGFFEKVATDKTLNPTHVSLYMALFQFWNCNRFKNPISINSDEVMRISKISSKATYHKCLKNLHSLGYINYEPSYNPFKGSHVILFNFSDDLKPVPKNERTLKNELLFEQVNEQALNKSFTSSGTSNETGTEQALVSYINSKNIPNISNDLKIVNLDEQAKNFIAKNEAISENEIVFNNEELEKEKISAKKEKEESCHTELVEVSPNHNSNPAIEEIKHYFQAQKFPDLEAQKFFNYFKSVGWLVGGKTPMIDWQAAAQNWMLNSTNFNHNTFTTPTNRAKQLNTTTDKDYSEPL